MHDVEERYADQLPARIPEHCCGGFVRLEIARFQVEQCDTHRGVLEDQLEAALELPCFR